MKILYVLMGSTGEYSDRTEWAVAVYENRHEARRAAERAAAHAREQEAILSAWRRDVFGPWHIAAFPNQHGLPFINPNPPPRPIRPERAVNPDDSRRGDGESYWVVPVPFLGAVKP